MKKQLALLFAVAVLLAVAIPTLAFSPATPPTVPITKPLPTIPPESVSLERAGGWPFGSAEAIAVDESRQLVFLGSGGAVLVFDVVNPAGPLLLSDQMHTLGFIEDLFYDPLTQRLYVAAGQGGLEIWDLQTPTAPQRLSRTEIIYGGVDIPILGVTVVGDMAYSAGNWGFLHWVDVSDPANPVQIGFNGQAVRPLGVTASTTHVYAVGNDTGPFFNGDFSVFGIRPDGSLDYQGGRDFGICVSAAVAGTNAYVGCGDWYILDLTDPFLGTIGMLPIDAGGTVISGTQAFVASYASGLHAVDITNPAAPVVTSVYDSPGSATDLARIGNYIYLADRHAGLRVVEISNPGAIAEVSFHDTPGWSYGVAVQDNTAYLANSGDGLYIIDVTDPLSATATGRYASPGAYGVAVQGDYAYVADIDTGLRVVDISDPANPQETGFYDNLDAFRVDVDGDYAYVADAIVNQPYWLRVIDVSDPANPAEVGAIELGTLIWSVAVRGDYVYIANNDTGLRIIDVSDPTQPVEVGTYLASSVWDVALQGDYAYVTSADWDDGLLILDISDPTNPTLVGEYNTSGWFPYHVAVLGRFAYVNEGEELYLFDVADPANPLELAVVDLPLGASSLAAAGPYVYVAGQNAGLPIFRNLETNTGITLGPDSTQEARPGTTASHIFTLQNLGMTDQFTLTMSGESWPTTLLASSPVTLTAGETVSLTVTVNVPHQTPDEPHSDTFSLTATALSDPAITATATGTTEAVIQAGADLHLSPAGHSAAPGTVVSYTFTLTNTGNYTDSFMLSEQSNWPVILPYTITLLIPPGGSQTGVFRVTIPAGALDGDQETTTLMIHSAWDPAVSATAQVTTMAIVEEQEFLYYLPIIIREE